MNNQTEQKNTFEEHVLEKIKTRNVRMKTRAHFVFKNILVFFVALVVFCISILCVSYIFFSLQASNQVLLLGFGASGIRLFFTLFPWGVFWVDCALIIILNMLLVRFKSAYRKPFLSVLAAVVLLTIAGGIVLDDTHVHETLMQKVEEGRFPIVGGFYENLRKSLPQQGIFKGRVVSVTTTAIVVKHIDGDGDADDWTQQITVSEPQSASVAVGDQVFIYARLVNGSFVADGIRKIAPRNSSSQDEINPRPAVY